MRVSIAQQQEPLNLYLVQKRRCLYQHNQSLRYDHHRPLRLQQETLTQCFKPVTQALAKKDIKPSLPHVILENASLYFFLKSMIGFMSISLNVVKHGGFILHSNQPFGDFATKHGHFNATDLSASSPTLSYIANIKSCCDIINNI